MKPTAIIYSENEFGKLDGKVANGLVRFSDTYEIVGVIDSFVNNIDDAGEYLDGKKNGIPIFTDVYHAVNELKSIPNYFIYGIAPLDPILKEEEKKIIYKVIELGMNIVNGLTYFFTDDKEIMNLAAKYKVTISDVRKPPVKKDLHSFTGEIFDITTPVVAVFGTDCAVGKRTTAICLVEGLKQKGLKPVFITTGQTGLMQGAKYGIAVDVLTSGFASGAVENAVLEAEKEDPDIIIIEGQGALSHQAFTSSSAILRGGMPKAIILQHPPKRTHRCDFPNIVMPTLDSEIELLEVFSKANVIAITLNHENMTDIELEKSIENYEFVYDLPATDVLKHGTEKLIQTLYKVFPELVHANYCNDISKTRN